MRGEERGLTYYHAQARFVDKLNSSLFEDPEGQDCEEEEEEVDQKVQAVHLMGAKVG